MNEQEIRTYLARNDYEALGRIADHLAFDHNMTFEQVFDLFERLGGDRELLEREFFADLPDRLEHEASRHDSLLSGRA